MKQKALSIEKMKYLEELGLDTSDASMIWMKHVTDNNDDNEVWLYNADNHLPIFCEKVCNAYTLEDILGKLPKKIIRGNDLTEEYVWKLEEDSISYYNDLTFNHIKVCRCESLLDAACEILIWCIENGHIKTK